MPIARTRLERWLPVAVIATLWLSTLAIWLLFFRPAGLLLAPGLPAPEPPPWGTIDLWSSASLAHATLVALLFVGQVAATELLLKARRARSSSLQRVAATRQPHLPGQRMPSALAWLILATAVGLTLAAASRFRFRMDDFHYLRRATLNPYHLDHAHRVLTTMAHFQVGVQFGHGHGWFAAVNFAVLLTMCAAWGALVYRAGLSRNASLMAASLLALAPGTLYLLRTGNGIEHLSATACVLVTILLVDLGARGDPPPWRAAMLILALCLSALGVLMKYQLMLVLVPSCWLWGRWVVTDPKAPFDRSVTYVAFVAALAVPLLLLPPDPDIGRVAFSPWWPAWLAWWSWLKKYAGIVLLLQAVGIAERLSRRAPGERSWRTVITAARDSLSGVLGALWVPIGRMPLIVWTIILSALWCLPFQLNAGRSGMNYYAMLMSAPAGAAAAAVIDAIEFPRRRWIARAALAVAVVGILIPEYEVRSELVERSPDDVLDQWLSEVHELVRDRPAPEAFIVQLDCGFDGQLGTSGPIDGFFAVEGVRWATGWNDALLTFRAGDAPGTDAGAEPGTIMLRYCPGEPATLEVAPERSKP